METRCGSLAQRSFYYPFKLAALTSTDEAIRRATMREIELDIRAVWAAQDLNHHTHEWTHLLFYVASSSSTWEC